MVQLTERRPCVQYVTENMHGFNVYCFTATSPDRSSSCEPSTHNFRVCYVGVTLMDIGNTEYVRNRISHDKGQSIYIDFRMCYISGTVDVVVPLYLGDLLINTLRSRLVLTLLQTTFSNYFVGMKLFHFD